MSVIESGIAGDREEDRGIKMVGRIRTTGRKPAFAVAILAALLLLIPEGIHAQPAGDLSSLSQQAARIQSEVNTLDGQLEIATEEYDRLQVDLAATNQKVSDTQVRLYKISQTLTMRRSMLNERIVSMYENGRASLFEVLLDARSFGDFLDQADLLSRVTRSDAELVEETRKSQDSAESLERRLNEQKRIQQGLTEQAAAQRMEIEAQLNQRQALLNGINQQIQQILAQQQHADVASEQALNQQGRDALANSPNTLQCNIARAALQFLGVPYEWAASGPNAFDCSGLTMYIYGMFGIDLPHNAALQFNRGTRISLEQALPGDLVFFGMPPHHVAIFLGNGLIVEAPHTGDFVKVSKLLGKNGFSGVCRYWK
jgi:cell wall-associated NlpC family hydrolase